MKTSDIEVKYVNHMGDDLSVVNAARVSFHKKSDKLTEQDKKLIVYLAKHGHHSPFNHTFITLQVKAPVFVARQLVKHKFMPWNEVSRRYVDEEPEFYIPTLRAKADNVKQGSSDEIVEVKSIWDFDNAVEDIIDQCQHGLELYTSLLAGNVAPEVARAVLPQNMMTEWWWSGTLGAWGDMLKLRLDPHTQYESRLVAETAVEIIRPLFPYALPAYLEN